MIREKPLSDLEWIWTLCACREEGIYRGICWSPLILGYQTQGIGYRSPYLCIIGVRVVEENRCIFLRYAIEPDTDRINKHNDNVKSLCHGKCRVALEVEMEG
jgi:hypothetical protein